jgi:hypothetical protein
MLPCSASGISQSWSIQLECLIAKLEFTCRDTTLSTRAFASSQRIRSNITVKIASQSNFWGGIVQAYLIDLKFRIGSGVVRGRVWPGSARAHHVYTMLRLCPHARAMCLASSARGQTLLAAQILRSKHLARFLAATAAPWVPPPRRPSFTACRPRVRALGPMPSPCHERWAGARAWLPYPASLSALYLSRLWSPRVAAAARVAVLRPMLWPARPLHARLARLCSI